ncbi:MAG: hypothetical protein Q9209_005430 [Squamulea sp. 1 TL-2023]
MEWPEYAARLRRGQRSQPPGGFGRSRTYDTSPYYPRNDGYYTAHEGPDISTQHASPLAAYVVPPALPRLVDSRANRPSTPRPSQYQRHRYKHAARETWNSDDDFVVGEEHPFPTTGYADQRNVVLNKTPWGAQSNAPGDSPTDNEFDDDSDSTSSSQEFQIHDRQSSRTRTRYKRSSGQAPLAKSSPYTQTIEHIHHSKFRDNTLNQGPVTAQLITTSRQARSPHTGKGLFQWM